MWTDESRFKVCDGVTYQSMGPDAETVLLSLDSGYLFTCNDTAAAFLDALDGRRTFAQIVDLLVGEYQVEPEEFRRDLSELAGHLLQEDLISIC